jgi:Asp-tRNA(Asn)/Glu-tRNA(Gln) amidotransferase A subunit family amidase
MVAVVTASQRRRVILYRLANRPGWLVLTLGLCAVTLPVGRDAAGMPVGLQLIGTPNSEARLLAMAVQLERLLAKNGSWRYRPA